MKIRNKITLFLSLITAFSFIMYFGNIALCPFSGGQGPP